MKKIFTVALLVIALAVSSLMLIACSDETDTVSVVDYTIDSTTYYVGDTMSTDDVAITANMSDDSSYDVTNNLYFVGTDDDDLDLDEDGAFTKTGNYEVKVYFLTTDDREENRFFLGTWKIEVEISK
jgi:hypothetical protein